MKYTSNVISLPKEIVDQYLDAIAATTDPILKEEDVPASVLFQLLACASAACRKSIVAKNLKLLEEAGLFKGVSCLDYPSFVWTLGSMRLYAVHAFHACLLKTLAEDLAAGRRTLDDYLAYLEIGQRLELEFTVNETLDKATDAARRRLEPALVSITQANEKFMLGQTIDNQLRLLRNIQDNLKAGTDPLANFEDDFSLIVPEPVLDI